MNALLDDTLNDHKNRLSDGGICGLFKKDNQRFSRHSLTLNGLLFDYSKNFIDQDSLKTLVKWAEASSLKDAINAMLSGDPINITENRQVLHTALRAQNKDLPEDDKHQILDTKRRIFELADRLQQNQLKGYTNKPIKTVVNIGVGGSDLGPNMAVDALRAYRTTDAEFLFVSNVDPVHISRTLKQCDPETTLFIICSKTFTTLETLANANAARNWFLQATDRHEAIQHHFYAVSTNLADAATFGIPESNCFPMWDWVGGRYSLWSAIGITIALSIGKENFQLFLEGGRAVDEHFANTEFEQNIPVLMGLLGCWYSNYWNAQSQAVICYEQSLVQFTNYLQQLDMESNGKSVQKDGSPVTGSTGAILWGGVGTNTQHSFHQLIHQGTHLIPVDFIVGVESTDPIADQQQALYSNCLAQSQAMMSGKSEETLLESMRSEGVAEEKARYLAKHRAVVGNKPSNTLAYKKLTPFMLGQLIALYEHKVFTQSVLWNINAFDQWGVELGKELSKKITKVMSAPSEANQQDGSTQGLIDFYLNGK